jgi:hypothetical protein
MKYLLALAAAVFLFLPSHVNAEPQYRAEVQGVVITLHSEECQIKDVVSNLPRRATWLERGKTFEGCFGFVEQMQLLMFYFKDDKTVAGMPAGMFSKVTGV